MKSSLKVLLLGSGIAATAMSAQSAQARCHSHHCYNGTVNAVAHRTSLNFDTPVLISNRPARAVLSPRQRAFETERDGHDCSPGTSLTDCGRAAR